MGYLGAFVVGSVISLPIGLGIGLIVGALSGEYGCKKNRFSEEMAIIAPILAGDPALARVTIYMYTLNGTATLYGEVATKEDLDRLRARMATLLGEARVKDLMIGVSARED